MNIHKNRIPQKYEADVQKLVTHIKTRQDRAGKKIKTTCRMLINCSAPAIKYSTCYHGEANVLMRGNGLDKIRCDLKNEFSNL